MAIIVSITNPQMMVIQASSDQALGLINVPLDYCIYR